MVKAYVMIKASTGQADRLKSAIESIDGVVEAHIVAGDIDLIAPVEVDRPAGVKDIAATQVQAIDGVEDTRTYIVMD